MVRLVPPEVYPLLISVGAAAAIGAYTLKRKWVNDPNCATRKSHRLRGVQAQFEGVEDVEPMWPTAKAASVPIVDGRGSSILEGAYDRAADALKSGEDEEGSDADGATDAGEVPAILTEAPEANVQEASPVEEVNSAEETKAE